MIWTYKKASQEPSSLARDERIAMRKKKKYILIFALLIVILIMIGYGFQYEERVSVEMDIPRTLQMGTEACVVSIEGDTVEVYSKAGQPVMSYRVNHGKKIMSSYVCDLDHDSVDELLLLTGENEAIYGENLVILSFKDKIEEVFRRSFTNMNPWKVQSADVDGDGHMEIAVGVYKKAKFHPVMAKRPFLYDFDGTSLSPKWRGSRLSRPFDDYIFADIDGNGKDEIVAIEFLSNGRKVVNTYYWKGFGFEGMGESPEYEDITALRKNGLKEGRRIIDARVKENNGYKWVALYYCNGKLVLGEE